MRKSHKEHLYKAAFKLFLTKQFEGVSISDIEEKSGMTRGAIFYYASTKKELFKQVIESFIIDKQKIENKMSVNDHATLLDFIDSYIIGIQNTMSSMQDIIDELSSSNASKLYISLILQISTHFPELHEKFLINRNNELSIWCAILQKAIESKEIRADLDVLNTAKHFIHIFYGQSFLDSLSFGLNTSLLKGQMHNFYKLLKKEEQS